MVKKWQIASGPVMPYKCPVCGRRFKETESCGRHADKFKHWGNYNAK